VRFSSTPTICPLHFTVEWAKIKKSGHRAFALVGFTRPIL
jgi:hypothetical protein